MVGVLIVCHGAVASSLIRSAELFFGDLEKVESIDYDLNSGVDWLKTSIEAAIFRLGGEKVLILTDLLGGSPTNISVELIKKNKNLELFTGINLPMLLEILFNRARVAPLELIQQAVNGGQKGILNFREFIAAGRNV